MSFPPFASSFNALLDRANTPLAQRKLAWASFYNHLLSTPSTLSKSQTTNALETLIVATLYSLRQHSQSAIADSLQVLLSLYNDTNRVEIAIKSNSGFNASASYGKLDDESDHDEDESNDAEIFKRLECKSEILRFLFNVQDLDSILASSPTNIAPLRIGKVPSSFNPSENLSSFFAPFSDTPSSDSHESTPSFSFPYASRDASLQPFLNLNHIATKENVLGNVFGAFRGNPEKFRDVKNFAYSMKFLHIKETQEPKSIWETYKVVAESDTSSAKDSAIWLDDSVASRDTCDDSFTPLPIDSENCSLRHWQTAACDVQVPSTQFTSVKDLFRKPDASPQSGFFSFLDESDIEPKGPATPLASVYLTRKDAFEPILKAFIEKTIILESSLILDEIPVVSEAHLVEQVIAMCLGTQGSTFQWNAPTETWKICHRVQNGKTSNEIRIAGNSTKSILSVLDRFLDFATHHTRLSTFLEHLSESTGSPLIISLTKTLQAYLSFIHGYIISLGDTRPSLLELSFSLATAEYVLRTLSSLVIADEIPTGTYLLSTWYNFAVKLEQLPLTQKLRVLKGIVWTCLRGFWWKWGRDVNAWMLGDEVTGGGNEFFIGFVDGGLDPSKNFEVNPDWFWSGEWQVTDPAEVLPLFLDFDCARRVLVAGKGVRLLKSYCAEHPLVSAEHALSSRGGCIDWGLTASEVTSIRTKTDDFIREMTGRVELWQTDRRNTRLEKLAQRTNARKDMFAQSLKEIEERKAEIQELKSRARQRKTKWKEDVEAFIETHNSSKIDQEDRDHSRVDIYRRQIEREAISEAQTVQEESKRMAKGHDRRMDLLDRMEMRLEWRIQRFRLSDKRREFMLAQKWETLSAGNFPVGVVENIKPSECASRQTSPSKCMTPDTTGRPDEDSMSFVSAQEHVAATSLRSVAPSSPDREYVEASMEFNPELDEDFKNLLLGTRTVSMVEAPGIVVEQDNELAEQPTLTTVEPIFDDERNEPPAVPVPQREAKSSFLDFISQPGHGEWLQFFPSISIMPSISTTQPRSLDPTLKFMDALLASPDDSVKAQDSSYSGNITSRTSQSLMYGLHKHMDLINKSIMHWIMVDLNLVYHISLLGRHFFLLDGLVATRLRDALFDTIQFNRIAQVPSLTVWTKSLKNVIGKDDDFEWEETIVEPLKERMSFLVKGSDELDICAVESTDVLNFWYNAPRPLTIIMGPDLQHKYNRVFSYLVRMMRVLDSLNGTFKSEGWDALMSRRDETSSLCIRFRVDSMIFLNCIREFTVDEAIKPIWAGFLASLAKLKGVYEGPAKREGIATEDLESLFRLHHETLDTILFRCILRTKQAPVMKIIQTALSLILKFSRIFFNPGFEQRDEESKKKQREGLEKMYAEFRVRVGMLYAVLNGLVGKGAGRGTSRTKIGRDYYVFEALCTRLEVDGGRWIRECRAEMEARSRQNTV